MPRTASEVRSTKTFREPEFGQRLNEVCDANPNVPPLNFGRYGWFQEQFKKRYRKDVSTESVRKWFAGEMKPRPDRIKMLAEIVNVDEAWLALGVDRNITPREHKASISESEGSILTVAGLIRMAGGHPAFPTEEDKRAAKENIDLYAVIRGAQYAMHIAVAKVEKGSVTFAVPPRYELVMQIGVIPQNDFCIQMVEIPEEYVAEKGKSRGGSIEVTMPLTDVAKFEIKSLRERL